MGLLLLLLLRGPILPGVLLLGLVEGGGEALAAFATARAAAAGLPMATARAAAAKRPTSTAPLPPGAAAEGLGGQARSTAAW
jgi:hypothetical protein